MNTMETSEQNGGPIPLLEAKGKGTAGNDSESQVKYVCPDDSSSDQRFDCIDPCEEDYYWRNECGCGPILFSLHDMVPRGPVARIVDAVTAQAAGEF